MLNENFLKILTSAHSPYDQYCVGYNGQKGYFNALTTGLGSFKKTFSHAGSDLLDSIVAYDRAEVDGAYIGQINMITVSSFCGPEGLIWGYDIAKVDCPAPPYLSSEAIGEFGGISIKDAAPLREAAIVLFGTNDDRHFPFLPGSHVPCAGKFKFFEGPTTVYAAVAIGVPEDRSTAACLFMEDVGQVTVMNGGGELGQMKGRLAMGMLQSVNEIGKNQRVRYKEILVDICSRNIAADEVGCALAAMPYFHLAMSAYNEKLSELTLEEWKNSVRSKFLSNKK